MKKILYILSSIFILQSSIAQINTNLIVSATPPSSLLQWSTSRETLIYMVQSAQGIQGQYKIKTEIKLSDGTVVGKTDLAWSLTYTLSSANTIYNANDVIPMQYMVFNGKYKTALEKTGKLPADNYEICVQLVRPPDYVPFSEIKCKSFYLASTQLPILVKPANEEALNYDQAKTTITFRWTPVVPKPKALVTYKIMVFEVLENQNPVQAMRSNMPILSQEVKGVTQYIWQPQGIISANEKFANDSTKRKKDGYVGHVTLIKLRTINPANSDSAFKDADIEETSSAYVWTIQSLDNLGQPIGDGNVNGNGVSEPTVFFVRGKVKDIKHDPGTMRKVKE
ncbi:MAG: hypothetical protein IPP48_10635 [Chitinophagaceae bacterium]|nr:hypothetical protein [Chitinophagaceae bacterium]